MLELLLPCLYSFLACIGFCIIYNIRGKLIIYASFGGALGWFVFLLLAPYQHELLQYMVAMMSITLYSEIMARYKKVPATLFLITGLIPLVPGGGIYYTMEHFLNGDTTQFLSSFIHTISIAGSLALSILIMSSLIQLYIRR